MGFAKYQEDNFSRYYAASIVRGREHDPFVAKGGSAEETKDTKKMEDKVLTAVDSRTNPASTAGTAQHDLDLVSG